jgi:hypothetical protein
LSAVSALAEASQESTDLLWPMVCMFGAILFSIIGGWYSIRLRRRSRFVATETPSHTVALRETLFGDLPLKKMGRDGDEPPSSHFAEARHHLLAGRKEEAAIALKKVLDSPGRDSLHYLQAWHFLRSLSHKPDAGEALRVLGVVIDVYLPTGLDLLAAYPDYTARFYSHSGAAAVWLHADTSLDADIDRLINAGAAIVRQLGPRDIPHPEPPPVNQVRMSFLTPGGICYGQGPEGELEADPNARQVLIASSNLISKLLEKRMQ